MMYETRRRKPESTLLPTQGIFNLVWEELAFDDTVKQCIHMCVGARAHARAHAGVLYRFSSFLVKGIH